MIGRIGSSRLTRVLRQAGFTSLGIASIIATALSFEFVQLINYHGKANRVTAKYGGQFLGMTWSAVAFLLVGSILNVAFAIVDRSAPGPPPQAPKVEEEGQA